MKTHKHYLPLPDKIEKELARYGEISGEPREITVWKSIVRYLQDNIGSTSFSIPLSELKLYYEYETRFKDKGEPLFLQGKNYSLAFHYDELVNYIEQFVPNFMTKVMVDFAYKDGRQVFVNSVVGGKRAEEIIEYMKDAPLRNDKAFLIEYLCRALGVSVGELMTFAIQLYLDANVMNLERQVQLDCYCEHTGSRNKIVSYMDFQPSYLIDQLFVDQGFYNLKNIIDEK